MAIPLFPLATVLFPGGRLALRIFEPRYLRMISQSLKDEAPFGIAAIKTGSEIGAAETYDIGTLAEIVDWRQEPDGLLGVTVMGGRKFAIDGTHRAPDGLYVADVRIAAAEHDAPLPSAHARLAQLLAELIARSGAPREPEPRFTDAIWVGYRLAELLPLPLGVRQELLEMPSADARLERLQEALRSRTEPH